MVKLVALLVITTEGVGSSLAMVHLYIHIPNTDNMLHGHGSKVLFISLHINSAEALLLPLYPCLIFFSFSRHYL